MLAAVHRLFANFRCMSEDVDLGGAWNGQYFYPGEPEAVTFVALLIDTGGRFSGSIHEYECIISERRILLYATVDGRHEGSQVSFLKTYDGTGGWTHTVGYDGSLNADATEIAGRWYINGIRGRFVMIRAGAVEEAELREALEPVGTG
jgi:hypothetical protein